MRKAGVGSRQRKDEAEKDPRGRKRLDGSNRASIPQTEQGLIMAIQAEVPEFPGWVSEIVDEELEKQGGIVAYKPSKMTLWRERLKVAEKYLDDAEKGNLLALQDYIYALARDTGAGLKQIADFLGVDYQRLSNLAGTAWTVGNTELKLKLYRRQLSMASSGNNALMAIYAGKQFTGQSDDTVVAAVADDSGEAISGGLMISTVKANRDQATGATLGEPEVIEFKGRADRSDPDAVDAEVRDGEAA